MANTLEKISTEAITKATGKGWDEWLEVLDKAGAVDWNHKQIVAFLTKHYDSAVSDWWKQSLTVGYEKARGKRVLGQSADAGFQIGVQKTVPLSADALWVFLISPEGLRIWLDGTQKLQLKSKQAYVTANNISGEVRTIDPGKKLRITWKKPDWELPTTLQVYLLPASSSSTSLRFHHEKLTTESQRQEMKEYWQSVLSRLADHASR